MSNSAKVKVIVGTVIVEIELSSDKENEYATFLMAKASEEAQTILKKLTIDRPWDEEGPQTKPCGGGA